MLQQKVVIGVQIRCKKCRSKALRIAAAKHGVTSVAITGESENRWKLSEMESSTRLAWRRRISEVEVIKKVVKAT
ncbi:hypothetical protein TIFTF001_031204 [Ficus carica]|uniref:Uncharacterized protein n=1 Tax=Ficus carica TaxID=3494 RepID=A0AA88DUE1_FICCA|nr:hypothetical protein TIFTF001_031204 [Ficus carica]